MIESKSWILKKSRQTLTDSEVTINLTNMEFAIIQLFIQNPAVPLKNETIMTSLEKCLDDYKGLCMCMCRLNRKFKKSANGDRLFISVRNRGYIIKQKITTQQQLPKNQLLPFKNSLNKKQLKTQTIIELMTRARITSHTWSFYGK